MRPVAAIDVGTNSVLMLVARPLGHGRFEAIEDHAVITRLGRGVGANRRLSDEAIEVTLAALSGFGRRAHELGAQVRAVGTSALRDAVNAAALLEPAARALGAPIEVVSGEREARLAFRGAMHGLDLAGAEPTLVDVGGGSTELARQDGQGGLQAQSIDIGTVRLFDRHRLGAPASPGELDALRADVEATFDRADAAPRAPLVACGGTATTLAAVVRSIAPYDPAKIHGLELAADEVEAWLDRLAALSLTRRRALPGMTPGREDVLVAGIAILANLVRRARASSLTVSDGGVRTGLILDIIEKTAIDPADGGT